MTQVRIGFESPAPLSVTQVDATRWATTSPLIFHGTLADGTPITISVPVGAYTNWASIPPLVSWLVPKMTGAAAAVIHDYCYDVLCPAGTITYRDADHLFEQMLECLDIPAPTRLLMWDAVRLNSILRKPGGRIGALGDLPAMAAITAPALLLVAPAWRLIPPTLALAGANHLTKRWMRRVRNGHTGGDDLVSDDRMTS